MSKVLIAYHSDTGNTKRLAELIAAGAKSGGADVQIVAAAEMDMDAAAKADGLAIGSPDYFSYVAGTVKTFFDKAFSDKRFKGKPCAVFGTHGGGGKVVGVIEKLAKSIGLVQVGTGLLVQGKPGPADEPKAHQLGQALAEAAAKK
ncbi:MAG: flavodoxin family protein [Phycisphaerae bacterium]